MTTLTTAEQLVMAVCDIFVDNYSVAELAYYECLVGNLRDLLDEHVVEIHAYDCYDQDWFPILATKGIADTLNWDKLNMVMITRLLSSFPCEFIAHFAKDAEAERNI